MSSLSTCSCSGKYPTLHTPAPIPASKSTVLHPPALQQGEALLLNSPVSPQQSESGLPGILTQTSRWRRQEREVSPDRQRYVGRRVAVTWYGRWMVRKLQRK
uniref:Uncharacterized protein n=1 Tax=Knipowitschia caucasica TaxID=637954 RepID=A0AAV2MB91_KNICA